MRNRVRDLASRLSGGEPAAPEAEEAPCVPCQQKRGIRQFSLNDASVPPLPDDFVPVLQAGVAYTMVDGQVVLHDRQRDASHVLNTGAAFVWAAIDDESTTVEVVERVALDTGEDAKIIDRDVRMALAHFIAAGIVLPQRPGTASLDDEVALAAVEREPAERARLERQDAGRARVEGLLKRRNWCPLIGPVSVGATSVLVRTDDHALTSHLTSALASLPKAPHAAHTISVADRGRDGRRRYRIVIDNVLTHGVPSAAEAADHVLTELNLLATSHTPDKLLFHGGAVERDGLVVAVLGVSGQGKSTLTAALVARGWNYLTDELVIVDPNTLHVQPYPKALDLSATSVDLLGQIVTLPPFASGKRQVAPSSLGSVSAGGRLGLLVMLVTADDFAQAGGAVGGAIALSTLDALEHLMMNTFRETTAIPAALDLQAQLCRAMPVIGLTQDALARSCEHIEAAAEEAASAKARVASD